MFKRALVVSGLAALTAVPCVALADAPAPAPAAPKGPTLSDILGNSGITATGYIDAAYSSLLGGSGAFTSGVADRVFDYQSDSFDVHQAGITVAKQPTEGFGGLINLTAGTDVPTFASYPYSGHSSQFDVTQAFVQYASGPTTVIAGKYVTLAGAEVIAPNGNTNYSRSILFGYAIPFTHTGARLTYAASDTVNLIVGLVNGWDQVQDTNSQKTIEWGVGWTPNKIFSLLAQGYYGDENASGVPGTAEGMRNLIDLVGTYNVNDSLTLILNYDYGSQKGAGASDADGTDDAKWDGLAGYVNYSISDTWRVSFRAEYFDDKDGYRTGVVQKWKEGTATIAYMPTKSVEFRGEFRTDKSDSSTFAQTSGAAKSDQSSVGLEALYKF
jgi:hypothetical protein